LGKPPTKEHNVSCTRRQAITAFAGFLVATLREPAPLWASSRVAVGTHPDPRPGIDASRVLRVSQLERYPDAVPVFNMIRQIPRVADGIQCQCDCNGVPGYRSLLTCFEGEGMAMHCEICQNQAKLAFRMHKAGKSLAEIRRAIDREFA
jgi:hypothetical protein